MSELRTSLNAAVDKRNKSAAADDTDEIRAVVKDIDTASRQLSDCEIEYRAALLLESEEDAKAGKVADPDAEERERRKLVSEARVTDIIFEAVGRSRRDRQDCGSARRVARRPREGTDAPVRILAAGDGRTRGRSHSGSGRGPKSTGTEGSRVGARLYAVGRGAAIGLDAGRCGGRSDLPCHDVPARSRVNATRAP